MTAVEARLFGRAKRCRRRTYLSRHLSEPSREQLWERPFRQEFWGVCEVRRQQFRVGHGPVPTLEFTPTRNGDPPSLNTVQLSV